MKILEAYAQPELARLPAFMAALEQARRDADAEQWRAFAARSPLLRRWRYYLASDPYTRWGLVKPRGYPGDATLMDFAYGHQAISAEIDAASAIGAAVYAHTSGARQSESARHRIRLATAEIANAALSANCVVVSLASGHARELEQLSLESRRRIEHFIAIDVDPQAIDEAARSAGRIPFTGARLNVIKQDIDGLPAGDLVYSLGLFDYLDDEHAVAVLSKMCRQTRPGGLAIVANLAPTAANLGYCEAIMDWWMTTRDAAQLMSLATAAHAPGEPIEAGVEQHGCFNYLRIRLPGGDR